MFDEKEVYQIIFSGLLMAVIIAVISIIVSSKASG